MLIFCSIELLKGFIFLANILQHITEKTIGISGRFNDHVHVQTLNNGIHIASQRRFMSNKIEFCVSINAGAFQDPEGKEGTAHFLEHLLYETSEDHEFHRRGGYIGAQTNPDLIRIHGRIENTPDNLNYLLDCIEKILKNEIPSDRYDLEKRRILNEIRIYADTAQDAHLAKILSQIYSNGFSGDGVLGNQQTLSNVTLEDLNKFKKTWFVGPNIFAAFTGITDHNALKQALEQRLGDISNLSATQRHTPEFNVTDYRQNDNGPYQLYFAFAFPVQANCPREKAVASLAAQYLDKKVTDVFLNEKGIVYDIGAPLFDSYCARVDFINIKGNCLPEDAALITAEIAKIFEKIRDDFDYKEFETLKERRISNLKQNLFPFFAPHSAQGMVDEMIERNGQISTFKSDIDCIESISADEVQKLLSQILSQNPSIVTHGNAARLHSYDEFYAALNPT
jgi:predicted Zn-dependent peptidase